ncbi:hypothetical protein ACFL6P_08670 [Candidatus Latescibacterota bacterium]
MSFVVSILLLGLTFENGGKTSKYINKFCVLRVEISILIRGNKMNNGNIKKYLYICDNCDHEFYLKDAIRNRMVGCSICGEKTAYIDGNFYEDYFDILDKSKNFNMMDICEDIPEYDDQLDYTE